MWQYKKFRNQEFVPLIKFLVEMYQPDIYVEVGVQKAFTFNQISPLVKEAFAVDIVPMPNVIRAFNVCICQKASLEFAEQWDRNKQIDLLLIDADHKRESVLADFNALSPFVTPGTGLILLHDTYPAAPNMVKRGLCHSAWEAAREIHSNNRKYKNWEIVTLPGPYAGLSIIRNATKHLHWMEEK